MLAWMRRQSTCTGNCCATTKVVYFNAITICGGADSCSRSQRLSRRRAASRGQPAEGSQQRARPQRGQRRAPCTRSSWPHRRPRWSGGHEAMDAQASMRRKSHSHQLRLVGFIARCPAPSSRRCLGRRCRQPRPGGARQRCPAPARGPRRPGGGAASGVAPRRPGRRRGAQARSWRPGRRRRPAHREAHQGLQPLGVQALASGGAELYLLGQRPAVLGEDRLGDTPRPNPSFKDQGAVLTSRKPRKTSR
jgi:hypothetical protein